MTIEEIEVTVSFSHNGEITPISFDWRGGRFTIDSVGRKWTNDEIKYFLVMVPGERTFELQFVPRELKWYIEIPIPYRTSA